jgi:hypothetical protein
MNSKLQHSFADRPYVAEITRGNPSESRLDPRAGLPVGQSPQPLDERLRAIGGLVVAKFDRHCNL